MVRPLAIRSYTCDHPLTSNLDLFIWWFLLRIRKFHGIYQHFSRPWKGEYFVHIPKHFMSKIEGNGIDWFESGPPRMHRVFNWCILGRGLVSNPAKYSSSIGSGIFWENLPTQHPFRGRNRTNPSIECLTTDPGYPRNNDMFIYNVILRSGIPNGNIHVIHLPLGLWNITSLLGWSISQRDRTPECCKYLLFDVPCKIRIYRQIYDSSG